ncbi:MAG: hypothetical protein AAF576_04735 [Pseudomonadota bacterium]
MFRPPLTAFCTALCLSVSGLATPALSQETGGTITLELNRISDTDGGGCQVVFFGNNQLDTDFTDVTWRLAVFGTDGVFRNLLSLPLGALSAGKRRIVQFNLPSACAELSEIIVNDVAQCELKDGSGDSSSVCLEQLEVSSRTAIAFGL